MSMIGVIIMKTIELFRLLFSSISIIFVAALLVSCNKADKESNKHMNKQQIPQNMNQTVSKILPIAGIMTNEKPSLEELFKVLGTQNINLCGTQSICVDGSGYKALIYCEKFGKALVLKAVTLYIRPFGDIRFKDITPVLGTWRLVHESKFSSVSFQYINPKTTKCATIFAHLYDPPRNPKTPVQNIKILIGCYPRLEQK
jgi:hypothetical protein